MKFVRGALIVGRRIGKVGFSACRGARRLGWTALQHVDVKQMNALGEGVGVGRVVLTLGGRGYEVEVRLLLLLDGGSIDETVPTLSRI